MDFKWNWRKEPKSFFKDIFNNVRNAVTHTVPDSYFDEIYRVARVLAPEYTGNLKKAIHPNSASFFIDKKQTGKELVFSVNTNHPYGSSVLGFWGGIRRGTPNIPQHRRKKKWYILPNAISRVGYRKHKWGGKMQGSFAAELYPDNPNVRVKLLPRGNALFFLKNAGGTYVEQNTVRGPGGQYVKRSYVRKGLLFAKGFKSLPNMKVTDFLGMAIDKVSLYDRMKVSIDDILRRA